MFTKPYVRLKYAEWDIEPRDFPCTCFDGQTKFCSFEEMKVQICFQLGVNLHRQ